MAVTVTATRRGTEGWLLHQLSDRRYVIWEKRGRGRGRFEVCEKGAGRRGRARTRGRADCLAAALQMTAALAPSTPEEILAHLLPAECEYHRERVAELVRLGRPGTRLWVLPRGGANGHKGMGRAATSQGLTVLPIEALFGGAASSTPDDDLNCWVIRYRDDGGACGTGLPMTLEDARRAWWILSEHGEVIAGGPPIYDAARAAELAEEFGGRAQLGLGAYDPDHDPDGVWIETSDGDAGYATASRYRIYRR